MLHSSALQLCSALLCFVYLQDTLDALSSTSILKIITCSLSTTCANPPPKQPTEANRPLLHGFLYAGRRILADTGLHLTLGLSHQKRFNSSPATRSRPIKKHAIADPPQNKYRVLGVERPCGRLNTTSNGIDGRRVSRRLATA